MTSILVQHTFMINLLNRKIGTGVWNVKEGLLNLFGKSNAVGPWRKRHPRSLHSNCYTILHQNIFGYNRQVALCRKVIPFSDRFWYTLALCFTTVWSNRLVLFPVSYQRGWSYSSGRAYVFPVWKLSCSGSGRHHYRDFTMPDHTPVAQDLEFMDNKYIVIVQVNHGELGRKGFQIFSWQ